MVEDLKDRKDETRNDGRKGLIFAATLISFRSKLFTNCQPRK